MSKPYYIYSKFKDACGKNPSSVFISKNAMKGANEVFNLKKETDLLDFIYNDGLEKLEFYNSREWDNNPDKKNKIFIDAYEFISGLKRGYIAFLFNDKTKKWIIKSFKLSTESYSIFSEVFKKTDFIDQEEGNE